MGTWGVHRNQTVEVGALTIDDEPLTATAEELNRAADAGGFAQDLTASGAVTAGVQRLTLTHGSVAIAATIADAAAHAGFFAILDTTTGATHTVTLTSGTFDGTNNVATLNAAAEMLLVHFDADGNGVIILNTGSVALS